MCDSYLLGALDAEAAVAVVVTDDDEGLEARALSGARLLLHGHDLHDLVLERGAQEGLHDLVLLHRHREEVDLLDGLDLALHTRTMNCQGDCHTREMNWWLAGR